MAKVLLTGGSGFIGINVIDDLLSKGHEVISVDISPSPRPEHKQFQVAVNILDVEKLQAAFDSFQPDYLIHLAARTDLNGTSLSDYDVNTKGTLNVIQAANRIENLKKIIFASSMLVCRAGYKPSHDQDFSADTLYGTSKVEMEKIIRSAGSKAEWTIVRPTSIWGPWFKTPYRDFFDIVARGKFIDIGKKYCTKTYGFIGNSVYQLYSLLFSPASSGEVFYLGDEPPVFISDWAKEIAAEMQVRPPVRVPFAVMKLAAFFGDALKLAGIKFPMSSFRLKNMTTNNIVDLLPTYKIAPDPPYKRTEGVRKTIDWLKQYKN